MLKTKMPPMDCFREIGFDTQCWPDKTLETIFFLRAPYGGFIGETTMERRMENVSPEAVEEFIAYWQNQINVAKDYLKNNCNPNTHEWNKE